LNGLLATLHQNGAKASDATPSFPHSVRNQHVGGLPKYLQFETVKFSEWLSSAVKSAQGSSGPVVTGVELAAKAPPGIAERFHTALRDVASAWSDVVLPGSVRGRAEVQISTPAISLVRSEVIVHVYVRANYLPDHGTTPLPEPIHGEIRISYQLVPKTVQGKNKLEGVVP